MKKLLICCSLLFPKVLLGQDVKKYSTVTLTDSFWAKYSYIKDRLKAVNVIDYSILYNSILITDTIKIRCVIDSLDFTKVKIDKFYEKGEAVKKFGINQGVWYIQSKPYTVINYKPILNCLCD